MGSLTFWRIATDAPEYSADSLSDKGAEITGARWNRKGTALTYLASSISLACLETLVHLSGGASLPLNRYLVRIDVPSDLWAQRTVFDKVAHVGWDAEPAGLVSLDWCTHWAQAKTTLIAEVPSVIVPEERNILINPTHPDCALVTAVKIRKWLYDIRLIDTPHPPVANQRGSGGTTAKRSPRRKK